MFFESLRLIIVRSYVMSLDSGKTNQRIGRKKWCEIRSSNNDARGEVTSANFDARLQKIITIRPSTVSILTSRHGRLGLYFFQKDVHPKNTTYNQSGSTATGFYAVLVTLERFVQSPNVSSPRDVWSQTWVGELVDVGPLLKLIKVCITQYKMMALNKSDGCLESRVKEIQLEPIWGYNWRQD
jgi:hypothetical protein